MVIAGGLVAWAGDNIGRNIGKKRLKFGHLRPKHTAAIGVVLAGMLATLATIVLLGIIVRPVGVWIIEGDKAREEVAQLKGQVDDLKKDLESRQNDINKVTQDLNQKNNLITQKDKTLQEQNKQTQELQAQSKTLLASVKDQTDKANKALKDLTATKADIKKLEALETDLNAKIKDSQNGLVKTRKENVELQTANYKFVQLNTELEDKIKANEDTIAGLQKTINEIKAAQKALEDDYSAKQKENREQLQKASDDLNEAKNRLEAANHELQLRLSDIQKQNELLGAQRVEPLIYNRGDEVARITVPANSSRSQAQTLLNQLVRSAGDAARLHGATRNDDGTFVLLLGVANSKNIRLNPSQEVEAALADLTAQKQDYLLVARTPFNAFKNEPTGIAIDLVPDPVVYEDQQVVLTLNIDGTRPRDEIIDTIFNFLQDNLYNQAVKDGMVPAIGQPTPLGEITREQILDMTDKVVLANRNVRLQILADGRTRAGDRLKLTYRVRI